MLQPTEEAVTLPDEEEGKTFPAPQAESVFSDKGNCAFAGTKPLGPPHLIWNDEA